MPSAASGSSPARIAALPPSPLSTMPSPHRSSGQNLRHWRRARKSPPRAFGGDPSPGAGRLIAKNSMPLDDIPGSPRLEARLRREVRGEVLFDAFSRGRYSTDASIYQIEPLGVVVPKRRGGRRGGDRDRARGGRAGVAARRRHLAMRPDRGRALVLDCSKHMTGCVEVDVEARRARVAAGRRARSAQPGAARRTGCSSRSTSRPASRATIGGMTANNSCGARSLRYGNMVHNVRGDRRAARRRHRRRVRRGAREFRRGRGARALSRSGARHARACTAARPTRSSAASRSCCAGSAATTST